MPAARCWRARAGAHEIRLAELGRVLRDPVSGKPWTFRQIVQGLIDNFLDRDSEWRWRLNDEVPIPADVHPLQNPGLELTGPWHPLDMAFNALNSAAPMNMPDFEDASPAHFQPTAQRGSSPLRRSRRCKTPRRSSKAHWTTKSYDVVKKGKTRSYKIDREPAQVADAPGASAQHPHRLRTHSRSTTSPSPA